MARSASHSSIASVVCLADEVEVAVDAASNRRLHERLKRGDLHWLRSARIKYGPEVRVLDLSAGGMLIDSPAALSQDASIVVELTGSGRPVLVASRVLRCRLATLGEIVRYQGACEFKRPLAMPELAAAERRLRTERPAAAAVARAVVPAAPTAGWQKVIARYIDGRRLCGYTSDFHPSKPQMHVSLNPRHGESTFVTLAQLKALFFVREFTGDPTHVEGRDFSEAPQGRKVHVEFHDGEVLVGSTLGYRGQGQGFFVQPADSQSNNVRVFVTASGLKNVTFL